MDISLQLEFRTILTGKEFRLVGLALSGKLNKQEDLRAARGLNTKLLEARSRMLRDQLSISDGALEKSLEDVDEPETVSEGTVT